MKIWKALSSSRCIKHFKYRKIYFEDVGSEIWNILKAANALVTLETSETVKKALTQDEGNFLVLPLIAVSTHDYSSYVICWLTSIELSS